MGVLRGDCFDVPPLARWISDPNTHPEVFTPINIGNRPVQDIESCLNRVMDELEDCCLQYNPLNNKSNTMLHEAFKRCNQEEGVPVKIPDPNDRGRVPIVIPFPPTNPIPMIIPITKYPGWDAKWDYEDCLAR